MAHAFAPFRSRFTHPCYSTVSGAIFTALPVEADSTIATVACKRLFGATPVSPPGWDLMG
jgi:hypothetical protein